MSNKTPRRPVPSEIRWPLVVIVVSCLVILIWFKLQGLLLILPILTIAAFVLSKRPDSSEVLALRSSIALSSEDIGDVLAEFDHFRTGTETDVLADRTLTRPALLDPDNDDPDIQAFHHHQATARRFLSRLDARLANPSLEVSQLETLLHVTDQRALEIKESWLMARLAAKRLGPG